jgi:hypothetical protein
MLPNKVDDKLKELMNETPEGKFPVAIRTRFLTVSERSIFSSLNLRPAYDQMLFKAFLPAIQIGRLSEYEFVVSVSYDEPVLSVAPVEAVQ